MIALDGLAYGIDYLDALFALHLDDAHVHAAWTRPESRLAPVDLAPLLRDAYRAAQRAARRMTDATSEIPVGAPSPLVTLEIPGPRARTAVLRRVRAYAVASIFDEAMPLGMARLVASRLTAAIEPELPRADDQLERAASPVHAPPRAASPVPARVRIPDDHIEREPTTLSFGASRSRRSFAPQARATGSEVERARRILAYYEAHAPEPHIARHRLALRAGLTLLALDHPEALAPEAMVLLEAAVEDILGVDRAELRRLS